MILENLSLENFRNYEKIKINFNKKINIFYGKNAQGKTNILEAIFIGAIGKSFRASKDDEIKKIGKNYTKIEINCEKNSIKNNIKIDFFDKKNVFFNGIKLKKLSEILGKINVVLFTPDDINILKSGPKMRRKFLDIMISQLRPNYVYCLNMYRKTIEQRNMYLKQIKIEGKNSEMLEIWDEKLVEYAEKIHKYREEYMKKIIESIGDIHNKITGGNENIRIEYISDFTDRAKFKELLNRNRNIDIYRGNTTKGVHKDDFKVFINDKDVSIYGSQGQNRTVILTLKMAELQIIKNDIGENPILLLDDFMSELDSDRRLNFFNNIGDIQVIVTCTEKLDIDDSKCTQFHIDNGRILE